MKVPLVIVAALSTCSVSLLAQPSTTAPGLYSAITSYHVADENRTQYETWLRDRFRRYAEGTMKEDPSIRYVMATRVIYGGVKEPEANAYISYGVQGIPKPSPDRRNKVTKQLFDKTYEDFIAEARPLRKRLGQVLTAQVVGTPIVLSEGDVVRLDFKRVTPGRMQDYVQLERDYLRLREAQVKAGSMKAWGMFRLVLPGGAENDYDAFTVHVAKDLEQALTWGRDMNKIAATLDPPMNFAGMAMRGNDVQKIIRGETRVVLMLVQRQ